MEESKKQATTSLLNHLDALNWAALSALIGRSYPFSLAEKERVLEEIFNPKPQEKKEHLEPVFSFEIALAVTDNWTEGAEMFNIILGYNSIVINYYDEHGNPMKRVEL